MHRLDTQLPDFWTNLSFLSQCDLKLQAPTCSLKAQVDLSSAHLVNGYLTIPGAGLSLKIASFTKVYSAANPLEVLLISESRGLKITLRPREPKTLRELHLLCNAYSKNKVIKANQIDEITKPNLCPCCIEAARIRVRQIPQNPLTAVLAEAAINAYSLMISVNGTDGNFTMAHSPSSLSQNQGCLISEGHRNHFEANIGHLHAMRFISETIDGHEHRSLELLNSLGETTSKLSAPLTVVSESWEQILGRRDHCYNVVTS